MAICLSRRKASGSPKKGVPAGVRSRGAPWRTGFRAMPRGPVDPSVFGWFRGEMSNDHEQGLPMSLSANSSIQQF